MATLKGPHQLRGAAGVATLPAPVLGAIRTGHMRGCGGTGRARSNRAVLAGQPLRRREGPSLA